MRGGSSLAAWRRSDWVEDVVQEALIAVHKARHTYQSGASVRAVVLCDGPRPDNRRAALEEAGRIA